MNMAQSFLILVGMANSLVCGMILNKPMREDGLDDVDDVMHLWLAHLSNSLGLSLDMHAHKGV